MAEIPALLVKHSEIAPTLRLVIAKPRWLKPTPTLKRPLRFSVKRIPLFRPKLQAVKPLKAV